MRKSYSKIRHMQESNMILENRIFKSKINEASPMDEPEPVPTDVGDSSEASIFFSEGEYQLNSELSNKIKEYIKERITSSIPTIRKFHNSDKFDLPQLITFYVGTSSTGDFGTNKRVAEKRMSYLTNLYLQAMSELGIREDVAYKLLLQSNKSYTPSKIDRDFYDPAKVKPDSAERICSIVIDPITTKGLSDVQIGNISGKLIDASSIINNWLVDNVDEQDILNGILSLQTYSDIKDLNRAMVDARMGTLQNFLNDQLFDDSMEKNQIVNHLNRIARRSGKSTVVTTVGGNISIILENKRMGKLTDSDLIKIIRSAINEQQEGKPSDTIKKFNECYKKNFPNKKMTESCTSVINSAKKGEVPSMFDTGKCAVDLGKDAKLLFGCAKEAFPNVKITY
jgi:hypothetical protein